LNKKTLKQLSIKTVKTSITAILTIITPTLIIALTLLAIAVNDVNAAGASVLLTKPQDDANVAETSVEFEFIPKSDSTNPLVCELYVDNVKTGEANAVSGFPATISAELQPGSHSWLVSCVDENFEKVESSVKRINVAVQKQQASVQTVEDKTSAALTGFSVLTGAVIASEGRYLSAWSTTIGGKISFSANASNTGDENITISLVVEVKDAEEKIVAVTRSKPVFLTPGSSTKLNADWIPLKEGEYYAQGSVIDENEKVFQQSFVKIVVSPKSAASETALFTATLSILVIAVTSLATRKNLKSIKGT